MNPYQHLTEARSELRQLKAQLGRQYNEWVAARAEHRRSESAAASIKLKLADAERKHAESAARLTAITAERELLLQQIRQSEDRLTSAESERELLLQRIKQSEDRLSAIQRWYLREKDKSTKDDADTQLKSSAQKEIDYDAAQLARALAAQRKLASPENLFS